MMGGLGLRETYRASSLPVLNYCGVWFCSHLLSSTWEMIVFPLMRYMQGMIKPWLSGLCKERPRPLQILSVNLFSFYYISCDDMLHLCSRPSSQDQHHFWQKLKSFRFELWKYSLTCPSFNKKAQHHFHPEGSCLTKPGNWATCTGCCGVNSQIRGRRWVALAFLMKIILIFCSKQTQQLFSLKFHFLLETRKLWHGII